MCWVRVALRPTHHTCILRGTFRLHLQPRTGRLRLFRVPEPSRCGIWAPSHQAGPAVGLPGPHRSPRKACPVNWEHDWESRSTASVHARRRAHLGHLGTSGSGGSGLPILCPYLQAALALQAPDGAAAARGVNRRRRLLTVGVISSWGHRLDLSVPSPVPSPTLPCPPRSHESLHRGSPAAACRQCIWPGL